MLSICSYACAETETPKPSEGLTDQIIQLVNEHRHSINLDPLEENMRCAEVALRHSHNMADGITAFGHDGFDLRYAELSEELNILHIGENVAFGQPSAAEVMKDWIDSQGHRENIEGDFTHIGVGVAQDEDGLNFYTQIFIKL